HRGRAEPEPNPSRTRADPRSARRCGIGVARSQARARRSVRVILVARRGAETVLSWHNAGARADTVQIMCGIVGYVGARPALPIVMSGLARLQYRGYDYAVVAIV